MSIQSPNSFYAPNVGVGYENVEVPFVDVRAPSVYDYRFPIGKRWIDQVGQVVYTLVAVNSIGGEMQAIWSAQQTLYTGTATLSLGTATVTTSAVTANSLIFLTVATLGTVTAPQAMYISAKVAGTSFTITSADATDTSVVNYLIIN